MKGAKYFNNPYYLFLKFSNKKIFQLLSDKWYLKLKYRAITGHPLNLRNPSRFNEKIQWLKIYGYKTEYGTMVDKWLVKRYVSQILGDEYVVKSYGVWNKYQEIDLNALPDQFVLKCTHDSGSTLVCKCKQAFNVKEAESKLSTCLSKDYYCYSREKAYKNINHRIIAEEYLHNDDEGLHDYKVWCFNGKAEYIQYISGRENGNTKEAFFDRNWIKQDFFLYNPLIEGEIPRPKCLDQLLFLAEKLAINIPFVRVDFYILPSEQIKFGEMTFYPHAGFQEWHPDYVDYLMGDLLKL